MKVLGIDYGDKHIGLAIGDYELKVAAPRGEVGTLQEVCDLLDEETEMNLFGINTYENQLDEFMKNNNYLKFLKRMWNQVCFLQQSTGSQ